MWPLRRSSLRLTLTLTLRSYVGASRSSCVKSMPTITTASVEDQTTCARFISTKSFYDSSRASLNLAMSRRELSSLADASNSKEDNDDDLDGGLSEPEARGNDSEAEIDVSDGEEDVEKQPFDEVGLSDTEIDPAEKKSQGRKNESNLFKAIVSAPGLSVQSALDKWVEEGKELSREEITLALGSLRSRKMYGRALQLMEWLGRSNKKLEFMEKDYASQLDLIAKIRGLQKAEKHMETIPNSFRGELVYRTLLANCVHLNNFKKAEEIFNKMRELEFPCTAFACNQLLLMYKRVDRKKIADVLLLMEKENVKPSPFTYKILIDAKGRAKDIDGMDQIVETMKGEGVKPDLQTKAILVKHYTYNGCREKAEALLKEMEGENLNERRWVCPTLLRTYANLRKADEVERVWKVCESKPYIDECMAAVEAYGKLKKIEEAEAVFEMMSKKFKLSSKNYYVLLKVYENNKMLVKGKDLIRRMVDSGCHMLPLTWDALVKLYIQAGEVEKADSVLRKAEENSKISLMLTTYMAVLEQYAKRGDIHNAEKLFHKMRQAGYTSRMSQFQALVQAYVNAKLPAYGIRERMKADNLFPNRYLANQLALIDAFKKTAVSDLLD